MKRLFFMGDGWLPSSVSPLLWLLWFNTAFLFGVKVAYHEQGRFGFFVAMAATYMLARAHQIIVRYRKAAESEAGR